MKHINGLAALALIFCAQSQAADNDAKAFKARRQALMNSMGGGVAVLYGATHASSDTGNSLFVQESDFYYLTGISEPGAAVILAPGERPYEEMLFLKPRNPEVEDWDGRREPLGDALNEATGFEIVRRTNALPSVLTAMLQRSKKAVFLGPNVSSNSDKPKALTVLQDGLSRVPGAGLENKVGLISEMRRIKDANEIALIQRAINVTGKGILAAMKAIKPGMYEFQIQSLIDHTYMMEGAQFLGFSTISAWDANATVLHYQQNDQLIGNHGLMLIDTGAAWQHYSADVSRTFPVTGKFSPREKELYELVLRASDTAIKKVRVGADYYNDVHLTAKGVLEEAGYAKYFIHGTGHFLGLDVHDAGDRSKPFKEGIVITVEPGIYIPEEGIGIRIEDDILVTRDGPIVLSRHIPRTIREIEEAMAK